MKKNVVNGLNINEFGSKFYYLNNKLHREDGPAIETSHGDKEWFLNGERHRLDGPARICSNGTKFWYQNGLLHRIDGPALEFNCGTRFWYQNDELHRLDGPAKEYAGGYKQWFIEGKELTEEEFRRLEFKEAQNKSCELTTVIEQPKGYHIKNIKKGILGQSSKIQEELEELIDAEDQGNKIMAQVELSDLYGALEAVAESYNITMEDLKIMSDTTKRVFKSGKRK